MTARRCLVAIPLALVLATGCGGGEISSADSATGRDIPQIDAIFAAWDKPGSPGCALAVAQDGELIYSRGYGYANLDYDIPITPKTVFDVASVTKQFNAASLTMLALEGKLSLADDIRKWLPELPEFETPITLSHMVHHTSGLRDYLKLFPLAGRDDYYPISHAQILAMMSRQRAPNFEPGEQYAYSNTAYMLLAQVVERASGKSFGDFTDERIFGPLGMSSSRMYDNREEVIPHRSVGYDIDDNGHARIVHNYNFDVAGDGQLYSTMEDLLRWDNHLHGAEKPPIHAMMLTPGTLNNGEPTGYAQGLRLDEHRGLQRVGHGGSSWGFRTEIVRYLDASLSIAISCNFDSANPQDLARQVAGYYLADQFGTEMDDGTITSDEEVENDRPAAPALTPNQLGEFAGDYYSIELEASYRFAVENGDFVVRIEQEPAIAVLPVAADQFEIAFHPDGWSGPATVSLEFSRAAGGEVAGFKLGAGSEQGIAFVRR